MSAFDTRVEDTIPCTLVISQTTDMPLVLSSVAQQGTHFVIEIRASVHAYLVDDLMSTGAGNVSIRLVVHQGAQAHIAIRQTAKKDKYLYESLLKAEVHADARLEVTMVHTAHGQVKNTVDIALVAERAEAHYSAVYALHGAAYASLSTLQSHSAPATTSEVVVRAVVQESAQSVYSGMIYINEHATASSAQQDHKALVMDAQAHASASPMLEVLTNQVHCGHASAIGRVDEEMVWYLQSRGIPAHEASTMLLSCFLSEHMAGIKDDSELNNAINRAC